MPHPLIAALLLDAQSELVRAADRIPEPSRETRAHGLNAPGWIVAHAAFFLDAWLAADARDGTLDDCDSWLRGWFEQQRAAGAAPAAAPFADARAALDRVLTRTTALTETLTGEELARVPARIEENGWPAGTTVGYLVARAAAHLFAHASELNVVATAAGAGDMGLPGSLAHTAAWRGVADTDR